MRRRNFVTLLGSTMVMRSLSAHAQQSGGMRRIGVLMSHPETDRDTRAFLAAFREGLQKLGWTEGRNVRPHAWAPASYHAREGDLIRHVRSAAPAAIALSCAQLAT
jgi:putative tryptophan/tyrosine transport system substrate-binding protein